MSGYLFIIASCSSVLIVFEPIFSGKKSHKRNEMKKAKVLLQFYYKNVKKITKRTGRILWHLCYILCHVVLQYNLWGLILRLELTIFIFQRNFKLNHKHFFFYKFWRFMRPQQIFMFIVLSIFLWKDFAFDA